MKFYYTKRSIETITALSVFWIAGQSAAFAQAMSLATKAESSLGITLIDYQYKEPGVMTLNATKVGFDYSRIYVIPSDWPNDKQGWFVEGQVHYVTGKANYSSPSDGQLDNTPDWYYQIHGRAGKDINMKSYVVSPFVGIGFRSLFNDLRGQTSTGALGYRRESLYTTFSLGVIHRMHLSNQSQFLTTLEFLDLLKGTQRARLSDTSTLRSDVDLAQKTGWGLRLNAMRRYATWSIGPTIQYWKIDRSQSAGTPAVVEPKNQTLEIGLKTAIHF